MKVWAYGDSFVAGDQDIPGRVDAIEENMEYNRYNVSFVSHLAKTLKLDLTNRGISGCSNYVQLDRLWLDAPQISKDDIVIFGLTTTWRDRYSLPSICPECISKTRGPTMLHRDLVYKEKSNRIATIDLFYILSSIEKIEEIFGITVIKINLFHDVLLEANADDQKLFKFKNYIGLGTPGNTLIDLLAGNWGSSSTRIVDHSKWSPPVTHSHLFTAKSHPSIEGHKFISSWFVDQLRLMDIV